MPAFVGREVELRIAADVVRASPAVLIVAGPAGAGKTTLISRALADAPAPIVAVTCPALDPSPYALVTDILAAVGGQGGRGPRTGSAVPPGGSRPAGVTSTAPGGGGHATLRLLREALLATGALTLVVDDLQYADERSRELLGCLAAAPPPGLLLVVAYRSEEVRTPVFGRPWRPPPTVRTAVLELPPLGAAEVAELARTLTGRPVTAAVAAELHQLTAGNPLLVAQLCQTLEPGPADASTAGEGLRLPPTVPVPLPVRELYAARLAALPPAARQVARVAAVLEAPAGEPTLCRVGGLREGAVRHALRHALDAGVLAEVAVDRYGFASGLAALAVYRTIPGPERRRLHLAALRVLDDGTPDRPLPELLRHSRAVGDPDRVLRFTEALADRAVAAGETPRAVGLLREALADPMVTGPARTRLALKLGRVALTGLGYRETQALLEQILQDPHLPAGSRGELRLALGLLLMNQAGLAERGCAEITRAVGELRRRPALAGRGMAALGMPYWGTRHVDEHRWWVGQAEQAAARGRDPALSTAVFVNRLSLLAQLGEPETWSLAEQLTGHLDTVGQRQQVARAYGNLADSCVWLGHHERAGRYLREALRVAADAGASYQAISARASGLLLDYATGNWHGLAERAAQVAMEARDMPLIAGDARLVLGRLAIARGEWEEAARYLDMPVLRSAADGSAPQVAAAAAAHTRVLLAQGVDTVAAHALNALDTARVKGTWVWHGELAQAAVTALHRSGHLDQARRVVADLRDGTAGKDCPYTAATLLMCRASVAEQAGELVAAGDWYRAAEAAFAALPTPYDAAQAAEASARCALARGEPAADGLVAAAERFAALGAVYDAARAHRLARSHGAAPAQRRGRRGYGVGLSPREQEVARLLTLGRTNRQIAEVLFLSPRTVEHHVANVLRKLGADSRHRVALPGH
ncbi:LuxR C-terminal-related transcriptional regulator [Micromonospora sp. CPCC 205556]|uniref:LuxR C-terminal-related transcriptional regulator n=1 Tax=Micromonospora sp. CPCC 205556 TaxID=3122398 RepID=UPI002FF405A8